MNFNYIPEVFLLNHNAAKLAGLPVRKLLNTVFKQRKATPSHLSLLA
ncbi:hypothetical protein [Paenibacillus sp. FSL K6-2859]